MNDPINTGALDFERKYPTLNLMDQDHLLRKNSRGQKLVVFRMNDDSHVLKEFFGA